MKTLRYLIIVTIMLNTLHAQHKVELRMSSRPAMKTTDDEGVALGRGSVERTATHLILTSEDGSERVEVPRGDLSTPEVTYSWQRVGPEYVYTYVIKNREDSKVPIFSAGLRSGDSFSKLERLKPGESGKLVVRSTSRPALQPMYVKSMSRKFTETIQEPAFGMTPDVAFNDFVMRHMLPHNNTTVVWVMGPAAFMPFDPGTETADSGKGVAGPEFAQRPID